MFDGFSYLLGKRSGGWTNQNIDQREAVFKSLPEEIFVDMNTMIWGYVKCMSSLCHLVKIPTESGYNYTGGITLHTYDTDNYICYTVVGRLDVLIGTTNGQAEIVNISISGFETHNVDDVGQCRDFTNSYELENLNIVAYKGTPIELPTYTVTINNVSDPETYGMDCVAYSIDGGVKWTPINEPTIVLKDVTEIGFKDVGGYGGHVFDEEGGTIAEGSCYEVTYIPTKDTTLELYISW